KRHGPKTILRIKASVLPKCAKWLDSSQKWQNDPADSRDQCPDSGGPCLAPGHPSCSAQCRTDYFCNVALKAAVMPPCPAINDRPLPFRTGSTHPTRPSPG